MRVDTTNVRQMFMLYEELHMLSNIFFVMYTSTYIVHFKHHKIIKDIMTHYVCSFIVYNTRSKYTTDYMTYECIRIV